MQVSKRNVVGRLALWASWWLGAAASAQTPAEAVAAAAASQPAFEVVQFDSQDTQGLFSSQPVRIHGHLLLAATPQRAPAAVLNPACEGLMVSGGAQIKGKYQRIARFLHGRGFTVLLVDGFNPRGFEENCSRQRVDHMARLNDALGALRYLRTRSEVDPQKIALMAWGNSAGLQGMEQGARFLASLGSGFAAAVLYYPECSRLGSDYVPYAPVQVLVGDKDAWNPAAPCVSLAERPAAASAGLRVKVYPDTYHSFDQPTGEPRMNAFNPRLGMVGRNASAVADSYEVVARFLAPLLPSAPPQ